MPAGLWVVRYPLNQSFVRVTSCVYYVCSQARAQVREGRKYHVDCCMLFRRRHELRQHLGTAFPDLFLSLVIDAMDNAKTTLPRLEGLLHSKKLDNKGQTMACELLAVLVHGHMFYGSLVLPHLKTNAATSITVLHQVFTQVIHAFARRI